jgi:hypothetical protein
LGSGFVCEGIIPMVSRQGQLIFCLYTDIDISINPVDHHPRHRA